MWRRKRRDEDDASVLPDGLWEYLQPYIAEEKAPSLEWAVRRPVDDADDRPAWGHLVPNPAPAS